MRSMKRVLALSVLLVAVLSASMLAQMNVPSNASSPPAVSTITGGVANVSTGGSGSFSAYTQLIASTPKACPDKGAVFSGSVLNGNSFQYLDIVQFALGGAGSEIVVAQAYLYTDAVAGAGYFTVTIPQGIPAGTRISIRSSSAGAMSDSVSLGYSIGQIQ